MEQTFSTTPAVAENRGGLTGFTIKIIALGTMLLDHIYYIFEFTDAIPLWFSWLGRISAPLFLFAMVEGFSHTSNRKKYFLRIYLMSAAMGIVQQLICIFALRPDDFYPQNGIFQTLALLVVLWQGIDWLRSKHIVRGLLALLLPFGVFAAFTVMPQNILPWAGLAAFTVLPVPFFTEGGLPILVEGLILYLFHHHRKLQVSMWAVWVIAYFGVFVMAVAKFSIGEMFTVGYEWMSVFAAIFMLRYNGQRGRSMKGLFYAFYPAHIYILYALSLVLYASING